jgi:tetratricopeptide (TPR) repeat protein
MLPIALLLAVVAQPAVVYAKDGGWGRTEAQKKTDAAAPDASSKPQHPTETAPAEGWNHRGGEIEYQVGKRTKHHIDDAYTAIREEKYKAARQALSDLVLPALNPLERSLVYRADAYISNGESDAKGAVGYLEKAIAENALPERDLQDMRFQIAQLELSLEDWQAVVENLRLWFDMVDSPNSTAYYLLAIAYYQMNDYDSALGPALQAVQRSKEPQESWLQLLLAIRLVRKDYTKAVPIIEQLVRRFPKKAYWIQLSTVNGALGKFDEALVPLQLAYEQGLLTTDGELRRLAQLMLYLDLPYRAAQVLSKGLADGIVEKTPDVYEQLSNSWIAAREFDRAVEPLEIAARLSTNGDLYVRLAQVEIQREKWSKAIDALEQALQKGDLTSPGDAHLLMGIARYSRQQPQQALAAFRRAREFDSTRSEADTWLTHIERELQSS